MGTADGPHPDSEQLALLAMDAPVDAAVSAHVQSCAECRADLALIRSLMAGGESDSVREPEWHLDGGSPDDPADASVLAAAMQAQADGPDGDAVAEPSTDGPESGAGTVSPPTRAHGGRSRAALIAGAVVVAALLILAALLFWR